MLYVEKRATQRIIGEIFTIYPSEISTYNQDAHINNWSYVVQLFMKWILSIYFWLVLNILILTVVMSLMWLKPLANKSYALCVTDKIRLYN
jgi:hypothetical protein